MCDLRYLLELCDHLSRKLLCCLFNLFKLLQWMFPTSCRTFLIVLLFFSQTCRVLHRLLLLHEQNRNRNYQNLMLLLLLKIFRWGLSCSIQLHLQLQGFRFQKLSLLLLLLLLGKLWMVGDYTSLEMFVPKVSDHSLLKL